MPTDHCQLTRHWRKHHLPQAFHQKAETVKRKGRCQKSSPPSRTPQLNCKRSLGVPSWQWWQWQLQNINIAVYKYLYVHIYNVSATFTRICMYLALPTINNMVRPPWWFKSDTKLAAPRPMHWNDFVKKGPMQQTKTLIWNIILHLFMKPQTWTHMLPLSNRLPVGAPHAEHKNAKHSPRKLVLTHTQIASLSRARMPMCNMSDGHRSNTHM